MLLHSQNNNSIENKLPPYKIQYIESQIHARVQYYDNICSTINIYQKYIEKSHQDKFCIIAENQLEGRGQYSKKWLSQPAKQVMVSLGPFNFGPTETCRENNIKLFYQKFLKLLSSHANHISFKEPNDYYIENKKLAGILWTQAHRKIGLHLGLNILKLDNAQYAGLYEKQSLPQLIREKLIEDIYQICIKIEHQAQTDT